MQERPILFSTPMIQALLDGRKTQTRRILKCTHKNDSGKIVWEEPYRFENGHYPNHGMYRNEQWELWGELDEDGRGLLHEWGFKCPYGVVGDKFWVRETFFLRCSGTMPVFRADIVNRSGEAEAAGMGAMYGGWKPSIFMPRWVSRLTLEITDIRVERVKSISNDDARAEGVYASPHRGATCGYFETGVDQCFGCSYRMLWNQINGPSGRGWEYDPLVWAISFKVL